MKRQVNELVTPELDFEVLTWAKPRTFGLFLIEFLNPSLTVSRLIVALVSTACSLYSAQIILQGRMKLNLSLEGKRMANHILNLRDEWS